MKRFHNPWMFLLTFYLGQLDENLLSSEPQRQDSWQKSDADVCIVGQDREDRHQVIGRAWASINKGKLLCPIHIWPAMCLQSPYPAPIPPFLCGGRKRLWDFRTDDRRHVEGGIAQSLYGHRADAARSKTKTCTARSPHHLCAASARKPHGLRIISVQRLRRLHGNCTEIAQFLDNLCAASIRIYPGLPLYKKLYDAHRQCDHICRSL